jgi:hypothetical protein
MYVTYLWDPEAFDFRNLTDFYVMKHDRAHL